MPTSSAHTNVHFAAQAPDPVQGHQRQPVRRATPLQRRKRASAIPIRSAPATAPVRSRSRPRAARRSTRHRSWSTATPPRIRSGATARLRSSSTWARQRSSARHAGSRTPRRPTPACSSGKAPTTTRPTTDIGGTFNLGGAPVSLCNTLLDNATAYRYYRLIPTEGASLSGTPYFREVEFYIEGSIDDPPD